MQTNTASSSSTGREPLVIERSFDQPAAKIWEAWSNPQNFKQWWGPKNYTCPHCEIDFRTGGKCLACMRGEDGKEMWSVGTYLEIIPNKKMVVTDNFSDSKGNIIPPSELGMPGDWSQDLTITVELSEKNGKTHMKLTHVGIPPEMTEDCMKGWEESIDKLEDFVN